eukprot:m51a1_g2650 hypothetical protein (176) ;mRNA; r:622415-622942
MINTRVSAEPRDLQALHELYAWVPGAESIRPSPDTRASKEQYMHNVRQHYASESDYALQTVFGIAPDTAPDGRLYVASRESLPALRRFDRNMFPYCVPAGTRHWTLWYTRRPDSGADGGGGEEALSRAVTRDIAEELALRFGEGACEFVWYENPKMTIPDLYHVQVFWHRIASLT